MYLLQNDAYIGDKLLKITPKYRQQIQAGTEIHKRKQCKKYNTDEAFKIPSNGHWQH